MEDAQDAERGRPDRWHPDLPRRLGASGQRMVVVLHF